MHSNNNVVYQHQHHPGREPSTTSASSSTSSKTSLSAAKAARSAILAEEFALARPVRVPVTRVHPHHLHHHPRFGYLYPADLEGGGNTGITGPANPPVILVRSRSPKPIRKLKHGVAYPPQVIFHPTPQGGVRVVPLSKRRGVSVEPVLLRRNGSGSSGKSNESRPPPQQQQQQLPKLTTPTLSFGDKMAGLRDAGTMKLFGPSKKRSQSSEKGVDVVVEANVVGDSPVADEDKSGLSVDQMPQRKNSTDALRTAVQHSKAALKKGLKIGSTGLTVLRRPVSNPAAAEVGVVTPEKMAVECYGYGFASEEDAALFGLGLPDGDDSKPEISVVSLGSYTQIDPSFCCRLDMDPKRSSSDPQLKTDEIMTLTHPVVSLEPGGILKHSISPVDKNFPFDIPETRLSTADGHSNSRRLSFEKPSSTVRRVVTFSMPSGSKWKASQSSLSISTPDLRSLQQSSIDEDDLHNNNSNNVDDYAATHIPTTTESTTTTTFAGKPSSSQFHRLQQQQQQLGQELLVNPVVELPIWLESGEVDRTTGAQGKESKSYVTTTALLLRAQALLMKEIETGSQQKQQPKVKRRPRERFSATSSCKSNSSQSSDDEGQSALKDNRRGNPRQWRKIRTQGEDLDENTSRSSNGVKFKVGSPTPEIREKSPPSSDVSIDEGLSERLREMDVTDLMEQRDVFTRQIVTSLVALHQLNQELDRRRRRKSYSTFRQKDVSSQKWAYASSSPQTSVNKVSGEDRVGHEGHQKKGLKLKADSKISRKKKEDWEEEEFDPDLDVSENRESAKPVLVKSVSYPFLCERASSRNDDETGSHSESRPKSFLDELWNDFLNAPETKIGGSEEEEIL